MFLTTHTCISEFSVLHAHGESWCGGESGQVGTRTRRHARTTVIAGEQETPDYSFCSGIGMCLCVCVWGGGGGGTSEVMQLTCNEKSSYGQDFHCKREQSLHPV